MTLRAYTFILIFSPFLLLGQTKPTETYDQNYQDKWTYFELEDTLEVKIWDHTGGGGCGTRAFASLTLVITADNDTIRILDLCNTSDDYEPGEIISVTPAKKPSFQVTLPAFFVEDTVSGEIRNTPSDIQILRTAYGKLLKHETTTPNT